MSGRIGLERLAGTTERAARLRGVYLAIVTANLDQGDDSRHRVKVRFPWLPGSDESYWARILAPMAGAGRGTYFLPELDDQVLVVFEHGDISRPIVVGGLWSNQQKPPQKNVDGKNNIRVIKSKSGHRLILDDTAGAERVILVDSTRKNKIVLDSGKDTLTIESASGDIELLAPSGTVKLHGQSVKMTATMSMGGQGAELEVSGKAMNVAATGLLEIKSGSVMLNPGGGGAGALAAAAALVRAAVAGAAKDQVRERLTGGAAAGAIAASGSAAARQAVADIHLPDTQAQPLQALVAAEALGDEIRPGQPVEVSAMVDGADSASYEVLDSHTGEVIDSGPATVEDGRATARWNSRTLAMRPEISSVTMKLTAGGAATQTAAMPVAGRAVPLGAPSPSNQLIDPKAPIPAQLRSDIASHVDVGSRAQSEVSGAKSEVEPDDE